MTGVGGATVVGPPSSDVLDKLKGDTTNPTFSVPTLDDEGSERARTEVLPAESLPPRARADQREAAPTYDRAETAILTLSPGDTPELAPPPSFAEDPPKSSISGTALAAQPRTVAETRELEEGPVSLDDPQARHARTNKALMALAGLLFVVAAGIVILALARG